MDIGLTLQRNANRTPNKIAVKFEENVYTYRELNEEVNRLANGLIAKGIKKSDKVAIMMQNSDLFVISFYALMKIGAIAVPINYRLTSREVKYIIEDSDTVAIFFDPEYAEIIESAINKSEVIKLLVANEKVIKNQYTFAEVKLEDVFEPNIIVNEWDDAEILYTSGTTGSPKGALFDHHRVLHVGLHTGLFFNIEPEDNILHLAPLFHSAQLNLFLISATLIGSTQIIHKQFDPVKVLETIEEEKISIFFGIPTMYNYLLQIPNNKDYDLSSIKRYGYGAAPMPVSLIKQITDLFKSDQIYNLCGLTEGGPGGVLLNPEQHKNHVGAGGQAMLSSEVRVVDEAGEDVQPGEVGEFIIRSEMMMKEYYNKPEETAKTLRDGWLYTGDLATMNEENILTLVDRKKDVIISGGENIYSTEVENILYEYPAILEIAVVGVPHDLWGEQPVAIVVPKEGATIDYDELLKFSKERLARFKIPRLFYEEKAILRNTSGKILKYKIRDALAEKTPVHSLS